MKIPIVAVILAASALFTVARAAPVISCGPTNSPLLLESPDGAPLLNNSSTNATPLTESSVVIHPAQGATMPGPGVYEAQPYIITVVIPSATGDDCDDGQVGNSKIPTADPELILIPESEADQ